MRPTLSQNTKVKDWWPFCNRFEPKKHPLKSQRDSDISEVHFTILLSVELFGLSLVVSQQMQNRKCS